MCCVEVGFCQIWSQMCFVILDLYYSYTDGRRIGCAFVQYSSVFDASRALKHMNGQKIQGIATYIVLHVA